MNMKKLTAFVLVLFLNGMLAWSQASPGPVSKVQPLPPGAKVGFNPQPDPPGKISRTTALSRVALNPQPLPPGAKVGFNPQPDPPAMQKRINASTPK